MALTFSYGDYEFDPKPLFTISKEYIKTPSNTGLGTRYTLNIEGSIIPDTGKIPGGDPKAGLSKVFSGVDTLRQAFDQDFGLLKLQCDSNDPIISGYPRIDSLEINNASDNYVVRADYTISLTLPSLTGNVFNAVGPHSGSATCSSGVPNGDLSSFGIIEYSDEFNIEFLDERLGGSLSIGTGVLGDIPSVFNISRTMSARGEPIADCTGGYKNPWERAKDFITPRLGIQPEFTGLSGLLCPATQIANNYRTININKTEGTVNVTENYVALTASQSGYEDFEISTEQSNDSPLTRVTVNGTVNGIANVDYSCTSGSEVPKFNNAQSFWSSSVSGAIYSRANTVFSVTPKMQANLTGGLNPDVLNRTIGYNPIAGTVTYSYVFDNRPVMCYTGAITEIIRYTEGEPNDIFASLTVLGKTSGPVLQAINTIGPRTREISIQAFLPLVHDCSALGFSGAPDVYDTLINNYKASLQTTYAQVFVNSASKVWEPRLGRFTADVSYTVGSC